MPLAYTRVYPIDEGDVGAGSTCPKYPLETYILQGLPSRSLPEARPRA